MVPYSTLLQRNLTPSQPDPVRFLDKTAVPTLLLALNHHALLSLSFSMAVFIYLFSCRLPSCPPYLPHCSSCHGSVLIDDVSVTRACLVFCLIFYPASVAVWVVTACPRLALPPVVSTSLWQRIFCLLLPATSPKGLSTVSSGNLSFHSHFRSLLCLLPSPPLMAEPASLSC